MLNLTQHEATPAQIAAGVIEPSKEDKKIIRDLLTFNEIPDSKIISLRANALANIAKRYGVDSVMIGGAPFLMANLEISCWKLNVTPFYAFSKRESREVETHGGVEKISVFVHAGFVKSFFCMIQYLNAYA